MNPESKEVVLMSRQIFTITLFVIFILSLSAFAGNYKLERVHRVTSEDEAKFFDRLKEVTNYTPAQVEGSQTRVELGRTWYDYATNSVMGRMMAHAFDNGTDGLHFAFMKIFPQGAERYVTYDYYDLTLGTFFGNASVTESHRTGWGRVINGHNDEALVSMHTDPGQIWQDAGEAFFTFTSMLDVSVSSFPGFAVWGDTVVWMSQNAFVSGQAWTVGDTFLVSQDYMQTWTPATNVPLDPLTTDGGNLERWPTFNPANPPELSHLISPNITASSPNGSISKATTTDLGQSWTTTLIHDDDTFFPTAYGQTQYIIENFNQMNGMYTQDGTYHVTFGAVQGIKDTSSALIDLFPILYWNDRDQQLVWLTSEAASAPTDTATINNLANFRPGNGLGNAYPILAEGPNNNELVCIWQQWEDDGQGGLVTEVGTDGFEIFLTDIWGAYSPDGGQTWGEPFFVAGNPNESDAFPNITERFFWNTTDDSAYLDILYLYDPDPGVSLFASNNGPAETIWYYERVSVDKDTMLKGTTAIGDGIAGKVDNFKLEQNYPNPFNPSTTIKFNLPRSTEVRLEVFNTLGQKVSTLVNGRLNAGDHEVEFGASNFSSGIYFYRLTANDINQIRKMVLMK